MSAKYHYLAKQLEARIEKLGFNAPLPSERDLSMEFSVSRMTIRKAIDELVDKNKLYRVPHVGTFTTDKKLYKKMDVFLGFSREVEEVGGTPSTTLLEYSLMPADERIAKRLDIEIGSYVYKIVRLRKKNNVPLIMDESYFPRDIVPLDEKIVQGSIYQYIQSELGLNMVFADQKLVATFCKAPYTQHLEIDENTPVMFVELTGYLEDGRIFEYSESYKNSDRYELVIRSHH
jgi:DNA-binding GntR family transcriptional regulator